MKTDLGKVLTVSGEQGLFTYVAQATRGAILESMLTKKRFVASSSAKMSALSDISIFTQDGDIKLQDVLIAMKNVLGEEPAPSGKSEAAVLKDFFGKVIPNYDADKFYPSHMKKVVEWYNCLKEYASLDFETEGEGENKAADKEESAKTAAAKQAKEASKQKGAKVSGKQGAPAKASVPRKVV